MKIYNYERGKLNMKIKCYKPKPAENNRATPSHLLSAILCQVCKTNPHKSSSARLDREFRTGLIIYRYIPLDGISFACGGVISRKTRMTYRLRKGRNGSGLHEPVSARFHVVLWVTALWGCTKVFTLLQPFLITDMGGIWL